MVVLQQTGMLTFDTADLPLSTEDYVESIRALNNDDGSKMTLVNGVWREGWYSHYLDANTDRIDINSIEGVPPDTTGKAGYALVLDDDLRTFDLKPLDDVEINIHGLDTIRAEDIIETQNEEFIRKLSVTQQLGFVDNIFLVLGDAKMLDAEMRATYESDRGATSVLVSLKYHQHRRNVYTSSIAQLGDTSNFSVYETNIGGQFALQIVSPGDWDLDIYIKNVIL